MRTGPLCVKVKLCAFACALSSVFLIQDLLLTFLLALVAFCYLAAQRKWLLVRTFGIFYLAICLLLLLIRYQGLDMIVFSGFQVLMFFILTPVFLVSWDLITTPPGELAAFLSGIKTPTPVILGMLVIFRFFPTMKSELRGIFQSMRNRGLIATRSIVRHPAVSFEYVLVPLLLRCLQIADQLSVSAVARGAEAPGVRSSYFMRSMILIDFVWVGVWVATIVTLVLVSTLL